MGNDNPQAKLHQVKEALKQLSAYPLPTETRSVLIEAMRSLEAATGALGDNRQDRRLGALYQVSQTLGASLDLDQVLDRVMDSVIALMRAERILVVLRKNENSDWEIRAERNFEIGPRKLDDLGISQTVINTVLETGRGVVTVDARSDPRFAQQHSVVFHSLRSILCAPLLLRGEVVGAVYVDNRGQSSLFDENDLDLLNALTAQAAVALENARLYLRTDHALAQLVAELETLCLIDQELNATLELDQVLAIARRWAVAGAGADQAWILFDSTDPYLQSSASGEASPPPLDITAPQAQLTLKTKKEQTAAAPDGESVRLMAPITYGGTAIGVLMVEKDKPFTEIEIQFICRLSGRASTAIENARLYLAVQQANLEKTKFVSVVSHELRVPMTSIKGYTDLIIKGLVGPVNEQQHSFLEVIRNNVERMAALVADLSDISRIETGRVRLDCQNMEVSRYVEETVQSMQPKIEERNQSIKVDLAPDLPPVEADPNRTVQVLTNLVNNAWKYTPPGGKIYLRAEREGEYVKIAVQDTGIGISPEDQAGLFTQFFRSE
ncbi:MAG TPA: GAF domain-containing protein, partial [Anaerolineales bacterium]|nr:GAF domain-containing protein [Anaerolineales bacterium]